MEKQKDIQIIDYDLDSIIKLKIGIDFLLFNYFKSDSIRDGGPSEEIIDGLMMVSELGFELNKHILKMAWAEDGHETYTINKSA